MMKRDLKNYKLVAGERVPNKETIGIAKKNVPRCDYKHRDIDEARLQKWEVGNALSNRDTIISDHHTATPASKQIAKFRPARKLAATATEATSSQGGVIRNQHLHESEPAPFRPSLRLQQNNSQQQLVSCASTMALMQRNNNNNNNDYQQRTPRRCREEFTISNEVKIYNEKVTLLPHMRTITPNARPIHVKHASQFTNSEELDIINQMHTELPHMRTKTPNSRPIQQPADHVLTKHTDFINQNKYVLPSMRTISPNLRHCYTERNLSSFTLAWDA